MGVAGSHASATWLLSDAMDKVQPNYIVHECNFVLCYTRVRDIHEVSGCESVTPLLGQKSFNLEVLQAYSSD